MYMWVVCRGCQTTNNGSNDVKQVPHGDGKCCDDETSMNAAIKQTLARWVALSVEPSNWFIQLPSYAIMPVIYRLLSSLLLSASRSCHPNKDARDVVFTWLCVLPTIMTVPENCRVYHRCNKRFFTFLTFFFIFISTLITSMMSTTLLLSCPRSALNWNCSKELGRSLVSLNFAACKLQAVLQAGWNFRGCYSIYNVV